MNRCGADFLRMSKGNKNIRKKNGNVVRTLI